MVWSQHALQRAKLWLQRFPEAQSQPERTPHYSSPLWTYHRVTSRLDTTFRLSIGTTSTALPSEEETEPGWNTDSSMGVGGTGASSSPPRDTPARCLLTARMSVANRQVRFQFSHLLPTVAGPMMRLISQQSLEYPSQTRSNLGSGCGHTHPPRTSGQAGILTTSPTSMQGEQTGAGIMGAHLPPARPAATPTMHTEHSRPKLAPKAQPLRQRLG